MRYIVKEKEVSTFTRLDNELLEKLERSDLSGNQFRVLLCIIRSTKGFNKDSHRISISFISRSTDIGDRTVKRALSELKDLNVINVIEEGRGITPNKLGINPDLDSWRIRKSKKKRKSEGSDDLSTGDNLYASDEINTSTGDISGNEEVIDLSLKKEKNKKIKNKKVFSDVVKELNLFLKAKLIDRGVTIFNRDWNLKNYAVIESLLKSVSEDEIRGCIEWGFKDDYWKSNIVSIEVIRRILPKYQLKNSKRLKTYGTNDFNFNNL